MSSASTWSKPRKRGITPFILREIHQNGRLVARYFGREENLPKCYTKLHAQALELIYVMKITLAQGQVYERILASSPQTAISLVQAKYPTLAPECFTVEDWFKP